MTKQLLDTQCDCACKCSLPLTTGAYCVSKQQHAYISDSIMRRKASSGQQMHWPTAKHVTRSELDLGSVSGARHDYTAANTDMKQPPTCCMMIEMVIAFRWGPFGMSSSCPNSSGSML